MVRVLYVSIIFVDIAIGKLTGVILTCWSHVLPTRHVSVAWFGWRLLLEMVLVDEILEKFRRLEVMDSQSVRRMVCDMFDSACAFPTEILGEMHKTHSTRPSSISDETTANCMVDLTLIASLAPWRT